ncbi:hypothetical protein BJP34_34140 [Moorena producens PAL-8-15-08-1]|uniref:Uncharacterized protein n=1 Tax=Moorena producens PAL-8-15-08-1 TaxID=1458985 RepID=A0A1D8U1M4_9CYAN|nr:hypothetical protein BJP34_34140 [Moorena producens PAL-8-15-08-1]
MGILPVINIWSSGQDAHSTAIHYLIQQRQKPSELATVNPGGQGDWSIQALQPIYFPLPTLQNCGALRDGLSPYWLLIKPG